MSSRRRRTAPGRTNVEEAGPDVAARPGHVTGLRGKTIVCVSTIDWDFLWQGHQEIMSRFARDGNRVIFVENIGGIRSVRASDTRRLLKRLGRSLRTGGMRPSGVDHELLVITPILLPFPGSRIARFVNHALIKRLARRVRTESGRDPILFTFLPTEEALELLAHLRGPNSVSVYYCVADFRALAQDPGAVRKSEEELVRSSDLVFVNSPRYAERLKGLHPTILQFPGGVNLQRFSPARTARATELDALPRPLIGYIGGLHQHLDLELLRKIARAMPDASIVLVGPILADVSPLRAERNVHLLGAREPDALPSLIAAFDVGLIPYVLSGYTETVYPNKLFEYLAMGRPVVATDLPEIRALQLPELAMRVAKDHEQFIAGVRAAVADSAASATRARIELARQHDWDAIVQRMGTLIADAALSKMGDPNQADPQ
jgi:glycosyltransferase involved in cell wall biosynthesis